MSKKSTYKKIMTENTFVKIPRESTSVISNNEDAFDFLFHHILARASPPLST